MVKERSAGAVIFRKEENKAVYLLLHYHFKSDYWDFPKGNVEEGEDEKETVKREVREETELDDIVISSGFREKINYFYKMEDKTVFKEVVFYLAETKTEDVKISSEHIGYEWLSYEEALKKLKKKSKNVLKKANELLDRRLTKWV